MGARLTTIVFVNAGGHTGVGAAYSHPGILRLIIEDHLTPFLVGQDPARIEELWDTMYSLTRWYGRKGAAISAIGAVDTALWDLRGKLEGAPLFELLGAKRSELTAYASGLLWLPAKTSSACRAFASCFDWEPWTSRSPTSRAAAGSANVCASASWRKSMESRS